jgi:hypothetical protein
MLTNILIVIKTFMLTILISIIISLFTSTNALIVSLCDILISFINMEVT